MGLAAYCMSGARLGSQAPAQGLIGCSARLRWSPPVSRNCVMRFKLCVFITAFLLPLGAVAQSSEPPIQSEAELVSALCSKETDQRATQSLLKSYPHLINDNLWTEVNRQAVVAYYSQSPERSIDIYRIAIQVAALLHDLKLIAVTYYSL